MMGEGQLAFGDEHPIAHEIREMLGVGPYEEVSVLTPQFERPEGGKPPWTPKTAEEFDKLPSMSEKALRFLCCKPWDDMDNGMVLWCYPGEWYESIPAGYEIVDIFNETESFVPGETDDDIRFGCLPYGFLKAKEAES